MANLQTIENSTKTQDKKVNYYFELNKFYSEFLPLNKLTANQIVLYHAILYIANKANQINNLSIPLLILKQNTGLEKDAILCARKALQNKGLISFKQFAGCVATQYTLNSFAKPPKEKKPPKPKKSKANNFQARVYTPEEANSVFLDLGGNLDNLF